MSGMLILTTVLLVSAVTGQTFPGSDYTCDQTAVLNGLRIVAHPVCDLFYSCMYGAKAVVMQCPNMTLFDSVDLVCKHPAEAKCISQCQGGTQRLKCCDSYARCNQDGTMGIEFCPYGQGLVYDEYNGGCSYASSCVEHPTYCPKVQVVPKVYPCYRRSVGGNPCVYDEYHENGQLLARRLCAAGTAFNSTLCLCSIVTAECNPTLPVTTTRPGYESEATLVMEFPQNEINPVSFNEKTVTRQQNPYVVQSVGYKGNGYEGTFSPDPNTGKTGLQIPYFANNMIKGSFIIKITFRADNSMENPLIKLVSNEGGNDCQGTLVINAQFNGGSVQISAMAVGEQTAQLSGNLYISSGSDITVVFIYDGSNISGYATSPSSGRTDLSGNGYVGEKINNAKCNLQVVGGLVGVLKEFKVYEQCADTNRQV